MSSIPNSAMPHAIEPHAIEKAPEAAAPKPGTGATLLGLALAPPLIVFGLGVFAFSAMRALAADIARKVDASGGSHAAKQPREKGMGVPV